MPESDFDPAGMASRILSSLQSAACRAASRTLLQRATPPGLIGLAAQSLLSRIQQQASRVRQHSRLHSSMSTSTQQTGSGAAATSAGAFSTALGVSADERPFQWLIEDNIREEEIGLPAADVGAERTANRPQRRTHITEIRGPFHDIVGKHRLQVCTVLLCLFAVDLHHSCIRDTV